MAAAVLTEYRGLTVTDIATLRAALRRAGELSRVHTPALGCRSLDVLHVASALELGLRTFVTFDQRQQKLARAAGLKLMIPSL